MRLCYCNDLTNETIKNVNKIGPMNELRVNLCKNITNIADLNLINKLTLSFCNNVICVSNLPLVRELFLIECDKIKDVSGLGLLNKLCLIICENVKDVGNLRELRELNITNKVYGIHFLKNLEKLSIPKDVILKMKSEINKLEKINKIVTIVVI